MQTTETINQVKNSPLSKIEEIFLKYGVDLEKVSPAIIVRLDLLQSTTRHLEDEYHAVKIAEKFFQFLKTKYPSEAFTEQEKRIVIVGSVFADIGKTGPKNATPEQQKLIAEIYAIDNIGDPKALTAEEFFKKFFPDDCLNRISLFRSLGLNEGMTMREFYDLHPEWSLTIISGDGVPIEAIAGAATHHFIQQEGVKAINPENIIGADGRFTRYFGENVSFDRPEKLITILDKYDALRERGGKTHEEAIATLKDLIKNNPVLPNDPEFLHLVEILDELHLGDIAVS